MGVTPSDLRDHYGYALCGLGPAGCGFLLHAIRENAIGRLVNRGLVLIDRAATPGPGKVGRYQLTGNSLSQAFLDCVDDPKLAWLFQDLCASTPSVIKLRDMERQAPPLDIVGDFLTAMARRTIDYLVGEYNVPVLLTTSVETIRRQGRGDFSLGVRDERGGDRYELAAENVLCACGGHQPIETIRRCKILPGLRLGDHADRIIASDPFLMMSNDVVSETIPLSSSQTETVVVVGGSHSAMSTIDRLTDALGPVGLRRIIMLHREPLRLFYPSVDEADRDGYAFGNPTDICPMSGRVNRFGGLRYRSFDVAKSILETGRTPDQSVEVVSLRLNGLGPEGRETVRGHLRQAAAVIACVGYQANLPPVVDPWNREIELRNQLGGVEIDDGGRALTVDDRPIPGLYAFGIGSRLLKQSDAIGGEPSFRGSADGVWLYHNHGGSVILNALEETLSSEVDQPVQTTWRKDHDRIARSA